MVGVTDSDAVGKLIGTPLLTQEDRTHSHAFSVTADLPYKSISAANGGNNQSLGLRDNYLRFGFGVSMNARWFQKRNYD